MKKFVLNNEIMDEIVYKTENVVIQKIQEGKNRKRCYIIGNGHSLNIDANNMVTNHDPGMQEFEPKISKDSAVYAFYFTFECSGLEESSKEIADFVIAWAEKYQPEVHAVIAPQREDLVRLLAIGRDGKKPRKDLVNAEQIVAFTKYFFDAWFTQEDAPLENIPADEAQAILRDYLASYDHSDDNEAWFNKIRTITEERGYAVRPKDYKKNPEAYKGHVGDVSTVIRLAITGRRNSPDVWSIQQILGEEKTVARVEKYIQDLAK